MSSMTSYATSPHSGLRESAVCARPVERSGSIVETAKPTMSYSVVHLVTGETRKDLVVPQVVTHMVQQARVPGSGQPRRVVVLFLEAARIAARQSVRDWVREVQAAAPEVKVSLLPYVGRLGLRANARALSVVVRRLTRGGDVAFHCRGEWSVLWAAELARSVSRAGIVADIRGAWPEEALAMHGVDDLANADARDIRDYQQRTAMVRTALDHADQVLTVSPGMMDWLLELGVQEDHLQYVPSCVPRVTYSPVVRADIRRDLGLGEALTYAFLGSAFSYATIGDGLAPFIKATFERFADVRLLMLTDQPDAMRSRLDADGIASDRIHVLRAPQHDVWRYLCAADCGCILKAPGRLNRTWQPVKLGEYLAAGLPVVVSRGVGRVDDLIDRTGAGIVVDLFSHPAGPAREAIRVRELLGSEREHMCASAIRLCEEQFLWSRYIETVRHAYASALRA